jgi:imidazolonepropionase-like amidohydrolase
MIDRPQPAPPGAPHPRSLLRGLAAGLSLACAALGAEESHPEISVNSPVVALVHARLVDSTGPAAREDQTLLIRGGKIGAVGPFGQVPVPAEARTIDLTGKTVIPGLVMVHEHLFYALHVGAGPFHANEMDYSFPRLYLACGLTSIRTAGSIEPYADMEIKRRIDAGEMPGPKLHLTAPYIEGSPSIIAQIHAVSGPEDAAKLVNFWADQGFTSIKLYIHVRRDVAEAAIAAAHKRGLQVTGHIGVMTYREAAELGIDNIEHGFFASTDFVRGKKEGELPVPAIAQASLDQLNVDSPEADALIQLLVSRHVALTSTLTVIEGFVAGRPLLSARALESMSEPARENYFSFWARANERGASMVPRFKKLMALEKKFFDAGGLLVAGTDPTGWGNAVAGHGSLREVELLVEAGLTPAQALQVATINGARLLGIDRETGTIETGKAADLVVLSGNPLQSIGDIRTVQTVFKDGVGYDSARLLDSVKGCVGIE